MNHDQLHLVWTLVPLELWNTLYMVACSTFIALLIGLPLGVILTITDRGHLKENLWLHQILRFYCQYWTLFSFCHFDGALYSFDTLDCGNKLRNNRFHCSSLYCRIPFMARLVEGSLKEVDKGMIEAAIVMGSTPWQIISKILIPESLPSLILATTTTVINLIGYSAMAGTMGGGGLGKIAIQYGYQRFNILLMVITVIILIILVQLVQVIGHRMDKAS